MPKYLVKSPLKHNKKRFGPGAAVDLPEETAAPLLAAKAIEAVAEPAKDEKGVKGK